MKRIDPRTLGPTLWGIVAFLALLATTAGRMPLVLLSLVTNLLIFAALAYSINFITGLTGYVSFGHVLFMAAGGYGLAYSVGTLHWPPVLGVALGAVVSLALALGIGAATLRFRGVYFAIASQVTALASFYIVLEVQELGGGQGIVLNVGFEPIAWFYTIWIVLAVEVVLTYWITHGRLGYGIRSIRADEDASKTVGIHAAALKLVLFAISGLFAGAAGGVYYWQGSGIFPNEAFSLTFSLLMLAMIVIGGMGTLLGPLFGAVVVYLSSQYFLTILIGFEFVIIGLIVIVIALFVPEGIIGTLRRHVPELRSLIE